MSDRKCQVRKDPWGQREYDKGNCGGGGSILFVVVKLVITGVGNPDSGYWIPCGGGNMLVT